MTHPDAPASPLDLCPDLAHLLRKRRQWTQMRSACRALVCDSSGGFRDEAHVLLRRLEGWLDGSLRP